MKNIRYGKQKTLAVVITLFIVMSLMFMTVTAAPTEIMEERAAASEGSTEVSEDTTAAGFLKIGDYNESVKDLQEQLIALGFLHDTADGSFGPKTLEAVNRFQKTYGMEVSGEVDPSMTEILDAAFAVLSAEGKPDTEPADVVQFRELEITAYDDGTFYAVPDSVSNKTISDLYEILMTANDSYNASESIPETDVKPALTVDTTSIPEDLEMSEIVLLEDLVSMAAEMELPLQVTDTMGNVVTVNPDGSIASDTGSVSVVMMDAWTGEVTREAESKSVDELNWKRPGELWLGNVRIDTDENGRFVIPSNTVSAKSLEALRSLFIAANYAYANSTAIPADESEIDRHPEGAVQDPQLQNGNNVYPVQEPAAASANTAPVENYLEPAVQPQAESAQGPVQFTPAPAAAPEPQAAASPESQMTVTPAPQPAAAPAPQTAQTSNSAPESVPAPAPHTHSYSSSVTVQPTCTSTGVMTYTCSGCGDSYTESIPAAGHVTQEVGHYYMPHYLPPQYVCNACGAYFPDVDSIVGHSSMICHSGYHVDDFILEYEDDLGMNYADGCYGRGGYEVCVNCGAIVDQW